MLKLHSLITDHAIFQRDKPVVIRGTATPGIPVHVRLGDESAESLTSADGFWQTEFPARSSGGPYDLTVTGGEITLTCTDLLIGEVWLCSGQSNMEWTLGMTPGSDSEIDSADDALLRSFTLSRVSKAEPTLVAESKWELTTPGTALHLSAVGCFFAKRLREKLGCPVGIIVSAWGGTRISSWLPLEVVSSRPEYAFLLKEREEQLELLKSPDFSVHVDAGRSAESAGWEAPAFDDSAWESLKVSGFWQEQGWKFNGAVWYRLTVELPASWKNRNLLLRIGACDDFDDTFANGVRIGGLGAESPSAYATPREYPISAATVEDGRVTLAVRVFDQWGFGGIVKGISLVLADAPETAISLEGLWKAKAECVLPLRVSTVPVPPVSLYNGMIHPLLGLGLRGFLWYQGESDTEQTALYRTLLPDLISCWRGLWHDETLPFGIVQLAAYEPANNSRWEELRDAQLHAAQTVAHTGLVVTIDSGEAKNVHPRYKRPVGERLAAWALATTYGLPEEPWGSPLPLTSVIEADVATVRFSHPGTGLRTSDGKPLRTFQLRDASGIWQEAKAEIASPDTVSVRGVAKPTGVRYGWAVNPACNLVNSAGLPASPFSL